MTTMSEEGLGVSATSSMAEATLPKTTDTSWDVTVARMISRLASPPLVVSAIMVAVISRLGGLAWTWGVVYLLVAVLAPLSYLVMLVRRGLVTDLDVRLRKQRARPLLLTTLCSAVAFLLLLIGVASVSMVTVAAGFLVQAVAIYVITLRWKISVHCAVAAGAATTVWALWGQPAALLFGLPLVAWSRVKLHRHSVWQTIIGGLLGLSVFVTAFYTMLGGH